jgi:uncharacterized protein YndB with AHSA1/START domain
MTDTTTGTATGTVQVYRVHIKASAEAIWEAITSPEWSDRYGYGGRVEYDLRPGGRFRSLANEQMQQQGLPDVILDGEVLEADPPRRLVQTWRMLLLPPGTEAEGFTRLTYEIDPTDGGVCRLTVIHDLTNAPRLSLVTDGSRETEGGGGWPWVLSGLKTLLETGAPLENRS